MPSTETKYLWKCGECIFSKRYHFTRRIPAVHLSADLSSIDSFLQIAESEPAPEANVREPFGEEPNRSFCDCKSACKTKQKNGVGRGCPCRTANLPCVQNRCKCNLRSGPFLASLICSLMSSLAKIGPDQKSLKNSVWSAKFWPTKLVI